LGLALGGSAFNVGLFLLRVLIKHAKESTVPEDQMHHSQNTAWV
jgi:hypothetical protein